MKGNPHACLSGGLGGLACSRTARRPSSLDSICRRRTARWCSVSTKKARSRLPGMPERRTHDCVTARPRCPMSPPLRPASREGLVNATHKAAKRGHIQGFLDQSARHGCSRPRSKPTSAPSSNNTTKTEALQVDQIRRSSPPSNASASGSIKTYANFRFQVTSSDLI